MRFAARPVGRRQREVGFGAAQDRQQRRQQSGFPRARPAGDDQYFFAQRLLGGADLIFVQDHGRRRK